MSEHEVGFKHMTIEQLHGLLKEDTPVIVDIRDPASFQANRIPGAIHLTNENISDFLREADLDAPTIVCCYHGISSQQAAQFLVGQDFSDVYSLDGGFTQWQSQYPQDIEN